MNLINYNKIDIEKISETELKDLQTRELEEDYSLEDVKKYLEVNRAINNV